MEIITSRVLLRPAHPDTLDFYQRILNLPVVREFGPPDSPGVVFQLGTGQLEISGSRPASEPSSLVLWLQVREVHAELERLHRLGVPVDREARTEPWGLIEGSVRDPDGSKIVLVQVPQTHPLRRDQRVL